MAKHLLSSSDVCALFGNTSKMTLWRWLQDDSLGFPKPTKIRQRRYWDADEIEAFRSRMLNSAIGKRAA